MGKDTKTFTHIQWTAWGITLGLCWFAYELVTSGQTGWAMLSTLGAFISVVVAIVAQGTAEYLEENWFGD